MSDPFEKFKNPDGETYNGLKMMAMLTGFSEEEVRGVWDEVKASKRDITKETFDVELPDNLDLLKGGGAEDA